jgi:hypothetical protein
MKVRQVGLADDRSEGVVVAERQSLLSAFYRNNHPLGTIIVGKTRFGRAAARVLLVLGWFLLLEASLLCNGAGEAAGVAQPWLVRMKQ